MRRFIAATTVGVVLVLVGGYVLAYEAFGFVIPQVAIVLPSVDLGSVAGQVAGSIAPIRWNLVWPLAVVLLGLLLLSDGWRTRARSR